MFVGRAAAIVFSVAQPDGLPSAISERSPPPPSLPRSLRGAAQQSLHRGSPPAAVIPARPPHRSGTRLTGHPNGRQRWPSVSVSTWNWPVLSTSQISRYLVPPGIFAGAGNGEARRIIATTQGATSAAAGLR